jgi:hypothetical protein
VPLAARETGDGVSDDGEVVEGAPVDVPPGAAVVIELDARQAAGAQAAIVEADGPVVVDRVVRRGDDRRVTLGLGIPAASGAVPLDQLADDGPIGGVFAD